MKSLFIKLTLKRRVECNNGERRREREREDRRIARAGKSVDDVGATNGQRETSSRFLRSVIK